MSATRSTQTAATNRSVTTYASFTLAPSISALTRANKLYTATFNTQPGWSYRLQTITGSCRGASPLSTTSPIVWINPNAGTSCKVALYAEDIYGNSGATTLANPTLLDSAAPSATLVSASPTSLTGSGTIIISATATDDVAVSDLLILLKNSAGTTVATAANSVFQNGTDTSHLYATTLNVPANLPAGTYSIAAQVTDWLGKSSTISIGTIKIDPTATGPISP